MREVGDAFGQVTGGRPFGHWTPWAHDGRRFTEKSTALYHAPRTSAGKDRTGPAIPLEIYEWFRDQGDCGTVVQGSGDADYPALVDRARLHGRRLVLCAFSQSVSWDMPATASLFPLEPELGIRLAEHGEENVSVQANPQKAGVGVDDRLERFVREMDRLAYRMNLLGYNMLVKKRMLDWGSPGTRLSAAGWSKNPSGRGSWSATR